MEFYQKLPRNKKEFALFMLVISVISVHIIAPVITCFEIGWSWQVWLSAWKIVPFLWPCVIAIVLLTYIPAEKLTHLIVKDGDSFRSVVTINIMCTVFLMSILLTVIGTWVGCMKISMEPIYGFFYKWPRNMAISFMVEALIAQPIARWVISAVHRAQDKKKANA